MSDLSELYQEVILEHNRKPRNFKEMNNATHSAEGYNPLCGDKFKVFLRINNDVIEDVSFLGSGCAISKASASLMTAKIKGITKEKAEELFDHVHRMLTGKIEHPDQVSQLDQLEVLSGVCEFPMRVKCATLAWHAMLTALKNKSGQVSTE